MVRYLVIYGHGDGSWEAPYWSDPTMYWEVQECAERWPDGECDWVTFRGRPRTAHGTAGTCHVFPAGTGMIISMLIVPKERG